MGEVVESVALHDHSEYLEQCIDIICEEWGRSRNARRAMLEKSCPNLPYNVVLILKSDPTSKQAKVIGHSRLAFVLNKKNFAYIETVVVSKKFRGKGLGRKLMEETEMHAIKLGIRTLCLSTVDKQDFYAHLGYSFSNPVISVGISSQLFQHHGINNMLKESGMLYDKDDDIHIRVDSISVDQKILHTLKAVARIDICDESDNPPPPPSEPSPCSSNSIAHPTTTSTVQPSATSTVQSTSSTTQPTSSINQSSKSISQSSNLAPPPPPPLPHPSKPQTQEIIRFDAYHMQKCLKV